MACPSDPQANPCHFDVVVVGAGLAGSSAAIALARAGWRVALIDRQTTFVESGEILSGEAQPHLQYLGVWAEFLALGALPLNEVDSRWGGVQVERPLVFSPYGNDWIVPKGRLVALLRDAALRAGAVHYREDATRLHAQRPPSGVKSNDSALAASRYRVDLGRSGIELTARAVIDATGRSAWIGRQLGARRTVWDPLAAAVWQRAPAQAALDGAGGAALSFGRSFVQSHHHGWWYGATLPGGGYAVAGYFYPERGLKFAQQLETWTPCDLPFTRASAFAKARPTWHVSAASSYLTPCAGDAWVAIGDAACAFDPLASAGMLVALRTGARAAHALSNALCGQLDAMSDYRGMVSELVHRYAMRRRSVYAGARSSDKRFWSMALTHAPEQTDA